MSNTKGNGFAKLLLETMDWSKAPQAVLVEQGKCRTCYLLIGDTYTGVPVNIENGRGCWNSHNVVVSGDGAGFAFPPSATNFLGQKIPGSKERVAGDPYHDAIQKAISSLMGAAQGGGRLSQEELVAFLNENMGIDYLSFEVGEPTPMALARAGACGVEAFIIDFCVAEGITPKADVKAAVAHRLPRGTFQVASGSWGPRSDGYARSVRLGYLLREEAVKTGLTIKRVKRAPQA